MSEPTASQRSARVAAVFDLVAGTYEAVGVPWFEPIAAHLVARLAPRPGERVLDVGCGRGAALFACAAAVGPSGAVTGIDLSTKMVEATRRDVAQRGLDTVDLHVMDAAAPDLAGGFDVVVSSLVLFFLPDPAAAARAWVALLAPGGRLGVSTFAGRDPLWMGLDDLFTPYLPPQLLDARASGSRGPFATDEAMAALLADAGLGDLTTSTVAVPAVFDDAAHWLTWSRSHGQRVMWESVPEPDREGVRAAATEVLAGAPRTDDGRIELVQQVRLTTGARPA